MVGEWTGLEGERGGEMREKGCEERGPKAHSKNSDFLLSGLPKLGWKRHQRTIAESFWKPLEGRVFLGPAKNALFYQVFIGKQKKPLGDKAGRPGRRPVSWRFVLKLICLREAIFLLKIWNWRGIPPTILGWIFGGGGWWLKPSRKLRKILLKILPRNLRAIRLKSASPKQ